VSFGRVTKDVIMNDDGDFSGMPYLGTDAPINGGNSGGPLLSLQKKNGNLEKNVIGMNTWAYRNSDGLGGAIRSEYIAWVCTKFWGMKMMTAEEVKQFEKDYPQAK